jgi:hypothetical protein
MKSPTSNDKAIEVTRAVVHAWDPYSLLQQGAPIDEFDGEITQLVTYIPKVANVSDATKVVSLVFSRAFEPKLLTPESCSDVGENWFKSLCEAGLVQQA